MRRVEIGNPVLRDQELSYQEFVYPILSQQFMPEPPASHSAPFFEVISGRVSRRTFKPLTFEQLNALLWYSSRTISIAPPKQQIRWEHRPAPSAGGRHPIDVFLIEQAGGNNRLSLYQSVPHALALLKINQGNLSSLILEMEKILPRQEATVLWFGAQFERTLARYENGDSLVWKDAGVLTATFSFVAEALNLNFCPLGITGEPYLSQCFGSEKVTGVGGVYVGSQ